MYHRESLPGPRYMHQSAGTIINPDSTSNCNAEENDRTQTLTKNRNENKEGNNNYRKQPEIQEEEVKYKNNTDEPYARSSSGKAGSALTSSSNQSSSVSKPTVSTEDQEIFERNGIEGNTFKYLGGGHFGQVIINNYE